MRRAPPALAFLCLLAAGALASAAPQAPPNGAPQEAPPAAGPAPGADLVARGKYLATLGDCTGCHTRPGGAPYEGGLGLGSPFGTIYTANITSDPKVGIGSWSADQFWRALHEGRRNDGAHLYPAFPYPYFTHVTREDSDALRAYLLSVPASSYRPPANKLIFPVNIRGAMAIWNALFFRAEPFTGRADQSAEWNRGAYIVTGLGHCGACHTPKNMLQADSRSKPLQGGKIENWFAPDLDGSPRGLASWSRDDIVEFLKTGRNARSNGGASMAAVLVHSTTQMTDEDRRDIAVYLKSLPPSDAPASRGAAQDVMAQGGAVYRDECSACHGVNGAGEPRLFPALRNDANVQQRDPTTMVRYILTGSQTASSAARPTAFTMPAFSWKLNDREVAAVATYVRNSFGNNAQPVSASEVANLRHKVAAHPIQKELPAAEQR
ncbi:MAG TPA: cytochrome c [Caulobacteraceae bacterium]|jgi:mono/diheme cytochrome c family protein|nr:cytochrome c [Caulobacteraceae bacterium]